jgi:hypothetical protein
MRSLVAEEGLARAVVGRPGGRALAVVPRPPSRRSHGVAALRADDVVETIEAAGPGAVVLARGPGSDPAAAALPALGRMMGADVVLLPSDPTAAAWTLGVALRHDLDDVLLTRRLEGLASAAASLWSPTGAAPALRAAVLARWAGRAWRPCRACSGGGLPEGPCGRCGAHLATAAP